VRADGFADGRIFGGAGGVSLILRCAGYERSAMDWDSMFNVPEEQWFEALQTYVLEGGDINQKGEPSGWTLLHVAAEFRLSDAIILLVQHGANINAQDNLGWTPLHCALDADIHARSPYEDITLSTVKTLIELGVDQSIRDSEGRTILDLVQHYNGMIPAIFGRL
jgi:transformer-2 protein